MRILDLIDLNRGETLKQGDSTLLRFQIADRDQMLPDRAGEQARVVFMHNNSIVHEEMTNVLIGNIVEFSISEILPPNVYSLEIHVGGQIFPSDEFVFKITRSALNAEHNIIKLYGVDNIVDRAVDDVSAKFVDLTKEKLGLGNVINVKQASEAEVATLGQRLDETTAQLADNASKEAVKYQVTNARNKKDSFYGMSSKNLIGDSISQGFNSTNFLDNSWAGIMRKLMNLEFGTDNIGFVSFSTSNTDYQTLDYATGTWSERAAADGAYLGLMKFTSTDETAIFKVKPKVDQTMASICYEAQVGGGQLDVYVDGGLRFTIDTSIAPYGKNRKSDVFNITKGSLIELRKKDAKITTFSGMWYSTESQATSNCMFNNYARSGAKLVEIDNAVLNIMCDGDIVFFALGHNDCYSETVTIEQFKAKINYVRDKINANGSMLVVLDFIWKHQPTNDFRKELLRLATECKGIYIEPAKMFNFDNTIMTSKGFFASAADTSHPTNYGHKYIAELTAKSLKLSNTTKYAGVDNATMVDDWHYVGKSSEPSFQNSWSNVLESSDKYKTKFKKVGNVVYVELWCNGGTNNSVVFTLPEGYRPNFTFFTPIFIDASTQTSINMKNAIVSENGNITLKENYNSGEFKASLNFLTK